MYNGFLYLADILSFGSVHRDRFDWAAVLYATPRTGGGASCRGGERSVGEGVDTVVMDSYGFSAGGADGVLIGHELNHCMGQVTSSSPNSDGHRHSVDGEIGTANAAARMINMETHQTVDTPGAHMYPYFSYGTDGTEYAQAYEWNELRRHLRSMPRPLRAEGAPASAASPTSEPLFQILGTIDQSDNVTFLSAQRFDNLPVDTTTPVDNPPYELYFVDQYDTIIGNYGFDPFALAPGETGRELGSFYIVAPLPEGTVRIAMMNMKSSTIFYAYSFTTSKPVISNVSLNVGTVLQSARTAGQARYRGQPRARPSPPT